MAASFFTLLYYQFADDLKIVIRLPEGKTGIYFCFK